MEAHKFLTEAEKVVNSKILDTALYGWGTNFMGQLGLPKLNMVNHPKQIELPSCFAIKPSIGDHLPGTRRQVYISKISCGKRMSAIVASNGELWLCGNVKK